jgi:hypothetical protein
MASFDVMPFNAEHGGHNRVEAYELENAAGAVTATFRIGEFVLMDVTDGDVDEVAAGQTVLTMANIGINFLAAEDSQFNIERLGDARYVAPPNPTRPVSLYPLTDHGQLFVTRNVFNNTDTNIGPGGDGTMTAVNVGDTACIRRGAVGDHGIDIDDAGFRIVRILDATGRDTYITGAAADKVIFRPDPLA